MDTAEISVLVGAIALIAFTLWYFLGERNDATPSTGKAKYACPMHPWITSNKPGDNCSICGMTLVAQSD